MVAINMATEKKSKFIQFIPHKSYLKLEEHIFFHQFAYTKFTIFHKYKREKRIKYCFELFVKF